MRLAVVFSLATGAILALAKGALSRGERTLFRVLWDCLEPADVVLADCGFTSYADIFLLAQRGVDCVMRNHQRRKTGVEFVKRLGKGDRIIRWIKTHKRPDWMDLESWLAMPQKFTLRQVAFRVQARGLRTQTITVVTTLLDPKRFPTRAFADLYRRRWMAELFLRDIKTSLGMDILRCQTPAMIHKELQMYVIAYNLIRALMFQAAAKHGMDPFRISFKGTLATLRAWAPVMAWADLGHQALQAMTQQLLDYLAADPVPFRPDRSEPRAKKRRPKQYALLTKPRRLFQEPHHRSQYKKRLC